MPGLLIITRYWEQIAAAILAVALVAGGYYVRSIAAERDQLRQEKAVLTVQMQSAVAVQDLANRMTEAISQIRIRSNINVSNIEREPAPQFVDSHPLPFIPGGVRPFGLYSSGAPGGAGPAFAAGRPLPAGEPPGGILPH
jgi:hypothetical protein